MYEKLDKFSKWREKSRIASSKAILFDDEIFSVGQYPEEGNTNAWSDWSQRSKPITSKDITLY